VDPERGRFRSFLLTCARNFLANWRDRGRALKRGGDSEVIGLDSLESGHQAPASGRTADPEFLFEKHWALTLLGRVMKQLENEQSAAGSLARFRLLQGYLTEANSGLRYQEAAERLEMTPQAVRTAVYRLRHRFGELLRMEVRQTLSRPEDLEAELRFLLEAVAS